MLRCNSSQKQQSLQLQNLKMKKDDYDDDGLQYWLSLRLKGCYLDVKKSMQDARYTKIIFKKMIMV